MFLVEFNHDTELDIDGPPYVVWFDKGEVLEATSWKKDGDMIAIETRDYGQLIIFNEVVEISEKTKVHP